MTPGLIYFALLDWWPLSLLGLAVAGYLAGRIERRWLRFLSLAAAILAPLTLLFIEGLAAGCAQRVGGEDCMWYGSGMVLTAIFFVPASALAVGFGWLFAHLGRRSVS